MKKVVALILAAVMTLCFAACGEKQNTASLEEKYVAAAQKYIDSGDNDKAVELLKAGIEKTKSEKLQKMLDGLNVTTTAAQTSTEVTTTAAPTTTTAAPTTTESESKFVGTWQNNSEYGTSTVYIKSAGGDKYSIHVVFLDGEDDFEGTSDGDILTYSEQDDYSSFVLNSDYTMTWNRFSGYSCYLQRVS